MGESREHIELVRSVALWVAESYGERCWGLCLHCDLPEAPEKPELIGGYRPDVLARDIPQSVTIIGEAKTPGDVDNSHTRNQIRAFLRFLSFQPQPTLVIGTRWHALPTAIRIVTGLADQLELGRVRRVYVTDGVVTEHS